jgi:hypothetical protein
MGHIDGQAPAVMLGDGRLEERAYASQKSLGARRTRAEY